MDRNTQQATGVEYAETELGELQVGAPDGVHHERREHVRYTLDRRARVHEIDGHGGVGLGFDCDAKNVSRSGIGLRSRRLLYPGRRMLLTLGIPGRPDRVLCGEIRYARYEAGVYHVGVRFCAAPRDEPVQRWLRERGAPA